MKWIIKKASCMTCCLMFLFTCCHAVHAFFPSTREIKSKLQDRYGGLESIQLELEFADDPLLKLYLWQSGNNWRQEWVEVRGDKSIVICAGIGKGSNLRASYPDLSRFPLPILNYWFKQDINYWWKDLSIDPSVKSYQFHDRLACLVLGAEYGQSWRPQLWIEHENFVPIRLIDSNQLQWYWSKYRNIGNFYLPHKALIKFPFNREIQIDFNWRGINSELPPKLFDTRLFENKFQKAPPNPEKNSKLFEFLQLNLPKTR